jgi:hypothetical protein
VDDMQSVRISCQGVQLVSVVTSGRGLRPTTADHASFSDCFAN